jgi:hypothetical protein
MNDEVFTFVQEVDSVVHVRQGSHAAIAAAIRGAGRVYRVVRETLELPASVVLPPSPPLAHCHRSHA